MVSTKLKIRFFFDVIGFSFAELDLEHLGVFATDAVEVVPLRFDVDAVFKTVRTCSRIEEGELEMDGGIEIIQELAPILENSFLVLVLRQLIVDVLKLNGFGIIVVGDAAHAVLIHPLVRNGLLCRQLLFICALCPFDCRGDLPLFFPCEPAAAALFL